MTGVYAGFIHDIQALRFCQRNTINSSSVGLAYLLIHVVVTSLIAVYDHRMLPVIQFPLPG